MTKTIDLTGNWEFMIDWESPNISLAPSDLFQMGKWLRAQVPGTVHTDLLANEKIADPFYRDNELKVKWVAEVAWIYHKEFHVPPELLDSERVQLVVEGLDTFATIYVNDQKIAQTDNMFVPYRFDLKKVLLPGKNEIEIQLDSPLKRARELEKKHGKPALSHADYRVYARKAQYSFGWDWGPELPTAGIWRPIYIEAHDAIRIKDVFVETRLNDDLSRAHLEVQLETKIFGAGESEFTAVAKIGGLTKEVTIQKSQQTISFELRNPQLWWPVGYGQPHLHQLEMQVYADGALADKRTVHFGIRKIELVQERDAAGKSFLFKINNLPIFCRGANWIPADSFIPRISPQKYRRLVEAAREANMNMLRVWGGGIYEQSAFYAACDEAGMLVWQDFMFACGAYPNYSQFQENVSQEIEAAVRRLRNHPCIVIWCGNNENEWIWYQATGQAIENMPGAPLFHKLLPSLCGQLDPTRPYWPSSPFGGDDPNSHTEGNHHQWQIWSQWHDFTAVTEARSRFVTEFGFQAPANLNTLKAITAPEDRHPQSEIMEFHNKQIEGQERLFRFLAGHVTLPTSFEDFIYKCQVVQGEALKYCIEHWRRHKFHTAGALIWQFNDCWPVSSWSLIDSALKPKAAYYYTKRVFEPRLISIFEKADKIEFYVINDMEDALAATLQISTLSFTGQVLFSKNMEVQVDKNAVKLAGQFSAEELAVSDKSTQYLKVEMFSSENLLSENRWFFKRFKHLQWPEVRFHQQLLHLSGNEFVLKLNSAHFAKSVAIESEMLSKADDNYFDLDANTEKTVHLTFQESAVAKKEVLTIRSLLNR
ncbi:MAG: glycoside hydrolase family 2 protein [bacterium]